MSYLPNNNQFCIRTPFEAVSDPCTPTLNKRLTGNANPRTLVQPTIPPPSHDITYWRQNPSYNHSQINEKTPMNPSSAGFDVPVNASSKHAGAANTSMGPAIDYDTEVHSPYLNPLQPSIYTQTDVFQPINANMGISMTPQFPNTTREYNVANNEVFYDTNRKTHYVKAEPFTLCDSHTGGELTAENVGTKVPEIHSLPDDGIVDDRPDNDVVLDSYAPAFGIGPDKVYDPRFNSYGSSNRSYVDNLLGAPRYYYDDVNAARMPNYITRSKLDSCVTNFGDAYGKLDAGHQALAAVKECAELAWVQNSLDFRTNISKSLMRLNNETAVQNRIAPKQTFPRRCGPR